MSSTNVSQMSSMHTSTMEAATVIRHDEAPIVQTSIQQQQVLSHQEAPIVKTVMEQPIVKDSHKEIIHEHH